MKWSQTDSIRRGGGVGEDDKASPVRDASERPGRGVRESFAGDSRIGKLKLISCVNQVVTCSEISKRRTSETK
jgi:hypothetical protein